MNERLMHATVALAARCAERNPRPSQRAAREIAEQIAAERQFEGGDRDALLNAAESFAAPLVDPAASPLADRAARWLQPRWLRAAAAGVVIIGIGIGLAAGILGGGGQRPVVLDDSPEFRGERSGMSGGSNNSPWRCPSPELLRARVERDHGELTMRWRDSEPITFEATLNGARLIAIINEHVAAESCHPAIVLSEVSGTSNAQVQLRKALRAALAERRP